MDYKLKKVITRFAPSPTGPLHVGSARTALFNYIFTKQNKGEIILRIEDTDRARSKKEYEDGLISELNWLGLSFDEFYRQSERTAIYKKHLENLIKNEKAYISKEDAEKEGSRGEVIRFKNPNTKIKFNDVIRGEVLFDTTELGDFIIAKGLGEPLYHLAVVVDDFEMNVSHVIRGEDHISNTPRQILIQEALGFPRPVYAHIPLILAQDKSKLSKRKHGDSVSVKHYREQGILPQTMINFLALLGWNPGDEREIFSLDELVSIFDIKKVQKGGAVFNPEKLDWLNQQYLNNLNREEKADKIKEYLAKHKEGWLKSPVLGNPVFIDLIVERIKKWGDIQELVKNGELDYFFEAPTVQADKVPWFKNPDIKSTILHLSKASDIINGLGNTDWDVKIIKDKLMKYADERGRGEVLWPLRYALTGREKSADPFSIAKILGKEETLLRWQKTTKELSEKIQGQDQAIG